MRRSPLAPSSIQVSDRPCHASSVASSIASSIHRARLRGAGLLAIASLALLAGACSEEELPAKEFPVISQVSTTCEMVDTMDIAGPVLTGGEVVTVDEMLSSVTIDVPGLERMVLAGSAIPEDAEPLETPQTWTFTVPTDARVLCSDELVLTVEVIDEFGQRTSQTVVASP